MELALWIVVGALVLWNFYLHGKVKEKSIAAKTQQILRDWKLGKSDSWTAEFKKLSGEDLKGEKVIHRVVKATQRNYGDWTDWVCSCKHYQSSLTSQFERDIQIHRKVQANVGK